MPLFDWKCPKCLHEEKDRITSRDEIPVCPTCIIDMEKQLTGFGGYNILGNNSASQRPKQAGSFRKK